MRLLIAVLIAALATIGQAQAPASPFLTSGAEVCCGTQSPGTNSWRTETAARGTTSAPDRAAFGQMPDVRGIAAPAAATIATVLSQPHGDFEPQQERLTASHDQRHLFSTGSGVIHSVWSFQRERLAVTQFNYDDRNNLVSARISIATRGASNILRNKAAGDAFRDKVADALKTAGREVEKEVVKNTPFGRRVIDIEVSQGGKVLGGVETKVGGSRYLPSQRAKDEYLRRQGYPVNVVRDQ